MLNPWLGITVVLAFLLALMTALRAYAARCHPHPEVPRKLLHVGMGVATVAFPWVFAETWPVWLLATLSVLLLTATKVPNPLQRMLGGVVDRVERSSLGDIFFPISVAVIFQFSVHVPLLYCIPILLLTLADAVAALIGIFYGRRQYQVAGGWKSVEGSAAFFAVAFFSTCLPLLLFSSTGRVEAILLGLTIGLLVMLIEAIAWNGLDNLLVPMGGFLLLSGYLPMDIRRLAILLIATLLWVVFVFIVRRRSTLNDGALLGAALVGYLTWSLGGWMWTLPPMLLFLAYPLVWPNNEYLRQRPHDMHAVAAICGPGLLLLASARTFNHWELLFPYTVGYAAQLAFIGIGYARELGKMASTRDIAIATAKGSLILVVPFVVRHDLLPGTIVNSLLALGIVWIAAAVFNRAVPRQDPPAKERFPWIPQVALGCLASLLCFLPLYL